MTAPEITAAIEKLIASKPPPVTFWGVRYTQPVDSYPPVSAGDVDWYDTEDRARAWLAVALNADYSAELVSITGHVRVHPADAATDGGAR